MACAYLTDLATNIWNDIGQPTDTPVSYIQSKLISNPFLGKLNSLTANCFVIITGDILPALNTDEQGIYALMYEADFYTRKVNVLLNGTDIAWTTLKDGDSTITRSSIVDQARLYRDMQKQLNDQLRVIVAAYRQTNANARSVDFYSQNNNWNGNWYNGGFMQGARQ